MSASSSVMSALFVQFFPARIKKVSRIKSHARGEDDHISRGGATTCIDLHEIHSDSVFRALRSNFVFFAQIRCVCPIVCLAIVKKCSWQPCRALTHAKYDLIVGRLCTLFLTCKEWQCLKFVTASLEIQSQTVRCKVLGIPKIAVRFAPPFFLKAVLSPFTLEFVTCKANLRNGVSQVLLAPHQSGKQS